MKKHLLFYCVVGTIFTFGGCVTKPKYPITDHYDGERFYHAGRSSDKSFWSVIKWTFTRPDANYPDWIENSYKPELPTSLDLAQVAVTFVNHASFLLQTKNYNFLTDPLWSERTSPVNFAGPKRIRKPGIELDQLPAIQFILISHNHYDHMDIDTIEKLHEKFSPVFIMPLGNATYLEHIKGLKVVELDWWESHTINSAKITLVPARHWSSRTLTDKRKALWGGFVVEADQQKIYFSGDSGYSETVFKKIGETFKGFDLSLLPIGAYEPRWFMKENHMNPEEAVIVHQEVQSAQSLGMHYGCFRLSDEKWEQPAMDLEAAKKKYKVDRFNILEVGQTKIFKKSSGSGAST